MVLQVVPGHVFRCIGCLVKVTGMVVFYMKCELTIGKIIHYISLCSKGFWRNSIEHCEDSVDFDIITTDLQFFTEVSQDRAIQFFHVMTSL